ncbi:MAG: tetratricopeptide repeat protein [Candidatus Heimdallarchaeota archaeon]|nr:tetratricopeptide repeat protein [Candidatus Heimdallarchaeota archaeon]
MTLGRFENRVPEEEVEIQFYKRLLRKNPEKIHLLDFLANALFNQAEYVEAIHCWKKLLRKNILKDEIRLYIKIGQAYESLGEAEQAYYYYGEAIKRNPKNIELISKFGQISYLIENFEDALKSFKIVVQAEPDNEIATHNLGLSYYNLGHHDEALEYLEASLELDNESADSWYALATIYAENYLIDDALIALEKALTLDISLRETARSELSFYTLAHSSLFQFLVNI